MHPMMITAMGWEVETERRRDRREVHLRSLARAYRAEGVEGSRAASAFARRMFDGISLRLRLS